MKELERKFVGLPLPARLSIHAGVMFLWVIVIGVFQLYGMLTIAGFFAQFNDPCNYIYESANNVGGWSIAVSAILVPLLLGLLLRKFLTVPWLTLCVLGQIYFFAYNIVQSPC